MSICKTEEQKARKREREKRYREEKKAREKAAQEPAVEVPEAAPVKPVPEVELSAFDVMRNRQKREQAL